MKFIVIMWNEISNLLIDIILYKIYSALSNWVYILNNILYKFEDT